MRIERCSDQPETVGGFLHPLGAGAAMVDFIGRLRSLPDDQELWGLTSHFQLVLLDKDTFRSPWRVLISAIDANNYWIEYLMPEGEAPWPNAYVKGNCRSAEQAVQMTLTALDRSGAPNPKP